MSALISCISLEKIRARSVLRAGNIHNGRIRDRLAVAVDNSPCNTRSVCADYYFQERLGKNWETRIGHIPPVEMDRFCDVIGQIIGSGHNQQLVIASGHVLQFKSSVTVHIGTCRKVHRASLYKFGTLLLDRDEGHAQLCPIEFLARISAEFSPHLSTGLWLKSQRLDVTINDFDRLPQADPPSR